MKNYGTTIALTMLTVGLFFASPFNFSNYKSEKLELVNAPIFDTLNGKSIYVILKTKEYPKIIIPHNIEECINFGYIENNIFKGDIVKVKLYKKYYGLFGEYCIYGLKHNTINVIDEKCINNIKLTFYIILGLTLLSFAINYFKYKQRLKNKIIPNIHKLKKKIRKKPKKTHYKK